MAPKLETNLSLFLNEQAQLWKRPFRSLVIKVIATPLANSARARMHKIMQSYCAPQRRVRVTGGARRARTGEGGTTARLWGWSGTGERTSGSSALSERASTAFFPLPGLVPPPLQLFLCGFFPAEMRR